MQLAQQKMEDYYKIQEEYYEKMHRTAHDFKNHLTILESMVAPDALDVKEYVGKLQEDAANWACGTRVK